MSNNKILAIDTATDACSCALMIENQLYERYEIEPRAHTRLLLPMIHSVLKEANITLQELDVLAFGRGPGSFTGIRIACGVIQGLSFGLNKPVVCVSTLRALAQKSYRKFHATHVLARLDAKMQEIYWGLFVVDGHGIMQPVSSERLQSPEEIQLPEGAWFETNDYPSARDIALIGQMEYTLGHFVTAELALPVYIREDVVQKK